MYMTGTVNYSSPEEAYRVFRMLPIGTFAALDGATITYLQETPVQHGQVEFKGTSTTKFIHIGE